MSETPITDAWEQRMYAEDCCLATEPTFPDMLDFARQLEREIVAAQQRIAELDRQRDEEIAEFNAGFDACIAGIPYDELPDMPRDHNGIGYAWAAYSGLCKRAEQAESALAAERAEREKMQREKETAEAELAEARKDAKKWRDYEDAMRKALTVGTLMFTVDPNTLMFNAVDYALAARSRK